MAGRAPGPRDALGTPTWSVTPSEEEQEEEEEEEGSRGVSPGSGRFRPPGGPRGRQGPAAPPRAPHKAAEPPPAARQRRSAKGERAPCSPWPPQLAPPPWPHVPWEEEEEEEGALAAMLMGWYMSGYHTGFYVGLREGRAEAAERPARPCCRQKKSPRS